jgi:hypothetical protein
MKIDFHHCGYPQSSGWLFQDRLQTTKVAGKAPEL